MARQKQFNIEGMTTLWAKEPRNKILTDFYVFDLETGKQKKTKNGITIKWELNARPESFVFGVIYGHNFTRVIHSRKEFIRELQDKRYKGKKVFAHNFGKFDSIVLYDNIFLLDPEAIFIGSRFITATNGVCIFGDSLNIYKASVKEIGKAVGKEKLGMDDGKYSVSHWPKDKAADVNACIRDCEIVWDALHGIFQQAGEIKLTIGSLAMEYYRRYHQPFHIEHRKEYTKYFFDSYYGGRTEAFKFGKTHAKMIDVNSMYPAVMKTTVFPNPKTLKIEQQPDLKFFSSLLKHYEGCATCLVRHPKIWLGLLPYREGNKLKFPGGDEFIGTWNFNELRFAIRHGVKLLHVQQVVYGDKMPSPFVSFVDTLYLEKFIATRECNELAKFRTKFLMNNLYGKFGQRIDTETIYIDDVQKRIDEIREYQRQGRLLQLIPFNSLRVDCFMIVKSLKEKDISYSIPSFASYITSAGRVVLGEKLLSMKANNVVYCDTDSIAFEIDNGVPSSEQLGEWKVEDKIITEIRGLKNYTFVKGGKTINRIKGVPMKDAVQIDATTWEYKTLTGIKESLRRNIEPGILTARVKKLSGIYDKRKVLKDGTTEPIIV